MKCYFLFLFVIAGKQHIRSILINLIIFNYFIAYTKVLLGNKKTKGSKGINKHSKIALIK